LSPAPSFVIFSSRTLSILLSFSLSFCRSLIYFFLCSSSPFLYDFFSLKSFFGSSIFPCLSCFFSLLFVFLIS
jgi:hypothetical protein